MSKKILLLLNWLTLDLVSKMLMRPLTKRLDLQKCVNYIMSKNSGNSNTDMVENGGSVLGQRPEE